MIKINLKRDQAARTRWTFAKPAVSRMGLILLATLLLTAAGMGAWYFCISREVRSCTEKRRILRIKEASLQEQKKEIEKLEKLAQLRLLRIEAIEQMKESQKGPVLLLNHIIQSMPRKSLMWLTNLTQKEDRVRIIGYTEQAQAIPDFMSNLAESGIFKTVDLELIEGRMDASKFSLVCRSGLRQRPE